MQRKVVLARSSAQSQLEDLRFAGGVVADKAGKAHVQLGRVPHDRKVGEPTLNMIAETSLLTAVKAGRIGLDRGAEQVRLIIKHSGVGDRHSELDGAADGVGKQAGGSVQDGSWGSEVLV